MTQRGRLVGWGLGVVVAFGSPWVAQAEEATQGTSTNAVEEIVVTGRGESLLGSAPTASSGRVGQAELETRPILRAGEVLEVVPGLIATQHSGSGKANQFFLRGFNLDHGTDFSSFLEGVPLNLTTHGHGQGYLDLNSVIPEIVEVVEFRKGPYYADVGDFSSAGTSSLSYARRLDRSFAKLGDRRRRLLPGCAGSLSTSRRTATSSWPGK